MENLHWPLLILTRSVHFKNLTGASAHVGISQPQLSRLIMQLEKELNVNLLDRSARRKSTWTPAAFRLAEIYSQNSRKLQSSIQEMLELQTPTHIHIGTLEGLADIAIKIGHSLLTTAKVAIVELDVFDQNELDEKFYNGDLDLIFTARVPGKQKYKNCAEIGYQSLDHVETNADFDVFSPFEFGRIKKKSEKKTLISNSLLVRRQWLEEIGGSGVLPSKVQKTKNRDLSPVLIIATDAFNDMLWEVTQSASKK